VGNRNDRQRAGRPNSSSESLQPPSAPRDYNQASPVFCLHHLVSGYDVQALNDKDSQAQLALTLHKCAQMRWQDIGQASRKGAGTELIPKGQIRAPIPPKFSDQERFMAFRYKGKLPMLGVRINEVFHVLWVERQFGDVYDHGGS
jgi:hypothetical protein